MIIGNAKKVCNMSSNVRTHCHGKVIAFLSPKRYEKCKNRKNPERRHLKNCLRKVHTKFREAAMIEKLKKVKTL